MSPTQRLWSCCQWCLLLPIALPLRVVETLSIGLLLAHFQWILKNEWYKLLAGGLYGLALSCLILLLHALVDAAPLCASYISVYAYVLGAFVASLGRRMRCFRPHSIELLACLSESLRNAKPFVLQDSHYTGILIGLLFCFPTVTVRPARTNPVAAFLTWCQPTDYISALMWSGMWLFLGGFASQLTFTRHDAPGIEELQQMYTDSHSYEEEEEDDLEARRSLRGLARNGAELG